ncbi:hypothetical protein KC367_g246 [Hortaea werneckii]|nr:hypothetical protein KC367_g246 [Hortaea werneckii]
MPVGAFNATETRHWLPKLQQRRALGQIRQDLALLDRGAARERCEYTIYRGISLTVSLARTEDGWMKTERWSSWDFDRSSRLAAEGRDGFGCGGEEVRADGDLVEEARCDDLVQAGEVFVCGFGEDVLEVGRAGRGGGLTGGDDVLEKNSSQKVLAADMGWSFPDFSAWTAIAVRSLATSLLSSRRASFA